MRFPALCLLAAIACCGAAARAAVGQLPDSELPAGQSPPKQPDPAAALTPEPIDFTRDIEPLLATHCWRCHGERRQEGQLRLDSKEAAEQGGASGKSILAGGPQSELLRRVQSKQRGERMPLEGPSLAAVELDALRRWVEAGAPWTSSNREVPLATSSKPAIDESWYYRVLNWWEAHKLDRIKPALYLAIPVLLIVLVLERRRATSGVPRSAYVAAMLAVGGFGLALYAKGLRSDLTTALAPKPKPAPMSLAASPTGSLEMYAQGEIYQPKHPPRLGGRYYRGNDERNPSLFNGGFYQTAVIDLELLDADSNPLKIGDAAEAPLQIRVAIRRSPRATPVLFTDEKLVQSCLSPMPPRAGAELGQGPKYFFTIVEPGECWEALAPLPELAPEDPRSGELFLYYGSPAMNGNYNGSPHYQVSYRLVVDKEGRITPHSTLHMASCYQVSQIVKLPDSRMTPEQWFDFRPMPEIVEQGTSDPKLLGIEEHQSAGTKAHDGIDAASPH